ncbi:hypothetical protein H257_14126 [Aphanomyces astaci]|uniref:Uncharacterized protein n=1 Tax=Aphanomyces astaci TaxID=112090 RepID=W4FU27_APHAT|nr:hypothetical protein H257_14126 [Aphanomyces astaci]ETV70466.1 hypothetical protein H257_14126 [Aphanomyces astaci]|eukprot:XP_009840178.1 hypothetical protein H257_14126 [Aphanomyces astaci]
MESKCRTSWEAFAVVKSCKQLVYIYIRPAGFRLFTDYKSLQYNFNPAGQSPSMARYQTHKLERWALDLSSSPYTIKCLPGEDNLWCDLLSRWGAAQALVPAQSSRCLLAIVPPLQQPDFDWPSPASTVKTQEVAGKRGQTPPTGVAWNEDKNLSSTRKTASRSHQHTAKGVRDVFAWSTLEADVKTFVQACIHCLSVDGPVFPRPIGLVLHVRISMPTATHGWQKILVIKDDMSGFVRLWPSETSDAAATANGPLDWFTAFGGSHFKSEVIDMIRKAAGAHHRITTAYCAWATEPFK